MRKFKWIEWNLQKVAAHGLSAAEVESAFDRALLIEQRKDGSFQMFAKTPGGRRVWVDREEDVPDIFIDLEELPIFVITAY